MDGKIKAETDFKTQLAAAPEWSAALAAYDKIAAATKVLGGQAVAYNLFENGLGFTCDSFHIARTLLRAGENGRRPTANDCANFPSPAGCSLELSLFSEKPIYPDLETLALADSLTFLAGQLGADDPLAKQILDANLRGNAPGNSLTARACAKWPSAGNFTRAALPPSPRSRSDDRPGEAGGIQSARITQSF